MIVESYRSQFLAKVEARAALAAEDVMQQARVNLGGGGGQLTGSVRVVRVAPGVWRVGSKHPGAKAQERGAFIKPRRARALKFADGTYSMRARIPAKRWLSRAGRQWGRTVGRRLRSR